MNARDQRAFDLVRLPSQLYMKEEANRRRGFGGGLDTFTASQMYAIIVLPNGGPDLEAYMFANPSKTGWKQACSLFWQVAKTLAHAEQLVSFEVGLCPFFLFSSEH